MATRSPDHAMTCGSRRGFTLAEFLVVATILAILAGILFPAVRAVRRCAIRASCTSNLRQLGICALAYSDDWGGLLPAEGNLGCKDPARSPAWFDRLPNYLDEPRIGLHSIFQCAGFRVPDPGALSNAMPKSFKMNAYLDERGREPHYRLGRARSDEAGVALFVDAVGGETGMGQWGHCFASAVDDSRHPGTVNVLYLDCRTMGLAATPRDEERRWKDALKWLPDGWKGAP